LRTAWNDWATGEVVAALFCMRGTKHLQMAQFTFVFGSRAQTLENVDTNFIVWDL
jgi:hypothetical protein